MTSEILTPEAAAAKFMIVCKTLDNLRVVGIAGPGDALANWENTRKSIALIHEIDPYITFCLSTNGLMLPNYADEILALGVTHVTVTINAIDPAIAAKIYREITYGGKKWTGEDGAAILIKNQLEGLQYLSDHGVVCKVNIVMLKGINDRHIEAVVAKVRECGAYMSNIMPLIPAPGSVFETMQLTNNKELNEMRRKCELDLKQMYHCRQCRADAIGPLTQDCSASFRGDTLKGSEQEDEIKPGRTYTFAVATRSGNQVDQHFGQVEEFSIYRCQNSRIDFLGKKPVKKYCGGVEECEDTDNRMDNMLQAINGCDAVLALRIGYRPSQVLEDHKIKIFLTCDRIEKAIANSVKELEAV